MGKSTCPSCHQGLSTPALFNLQAWSNLACSNCKARLRSRLPSQLNYLIIFGISLTGLGGSHFAPRWLFLVLIMAGMTLNLAALIFLILEVQNPKLQIRKPLREPETALRLSNH